MRVSPAADQRSKLRVLSSPPAVQVDESPSGLLGHGANGEVRRGSYEGGLVALKSVFMLRTDAASTAAFGGAIPADGRAALLRSWMQVWPCCCCCCWLPSTVAAPAAPAAAAVAAPAACH